MSKEVKPAVKNKAEIRFSLGPIGNLGLSYSC